MELHPSRRARRALSLLTTMAITAALLPLALAPGASAAAKRTNLDKRDRELLAEAKANGETHVTVLIAAVQGGTTAAANAVTAAGGTIRTRDDALGYLRALVPTDKVKQVAASSAVQTIDLDEVIPLDDPVPAGQANPTPYPAPDSSTPRVNPYMPTGDTGAAQFSLAHPQWDGRGVTIGILDTGVDLDHPSLQTTSTGERKIVDWVTFTDPFGDNDPTWVDMSAQVTGPTFSFQDQTYTAPAADQYRIGLFNERDPRLGGELGNDVNRDGNPAGSSGIFAVLQGGSTVWVDTDQDLDFNDEAAMRDYAVHHDVGHFGTDVPATPVQERLPYVVQVDLPDKVVNIGIVSGAHGTHTTGIMSANGLFGGDMAGAAPGAKVVSVRVCLFIAGCTAHALVEGMIWVVKEAHVDVVNMSIGGLPSLNDGNNTRAVIYNRLIDQYGVQMFISAGNSGPGTNTVGDPSVATEVMSVGAYITDATWESNYGSTAPAPGTDNLHPFSSRGPREDGGLKPQIVAPGAAISSTPLWQPGGPVAGVHDLPPGYSMFNGTSMAAPQATGAAALLLSAAKAGNVAADPARLRLALNSTARFLDGYGAHEQGNGLIDVGAAWNLLTQNPQPVDITSSVPVNTLLAGFLATPGTGVGIHDREGVTLGQSYTRTYTFRRNSGPGGTIAYDVEWVGNDGTFSSAATINLKKGVPATLPVSVDPSVYGAHSALLNLDNPATPGIDYQTMNVVVVPYEFSAANGYAQVFNGSVARNQALSYFVRVPAGATALKVDFTGPNATPGTGQARFLRFHPYGVPIDSNTSTVCYSPPVVPGGSCPGGGPNSRTTTNPTPGVWEVTVEARRTSDIALTPFTLDGERHGRLDVAAGDDREPERSRSRPRPVRLQLHQRDLRPGRAERGRGLRGIGDDQQPGCRRVAGARGRLLGPGRDDAVRLRRRVREPGVREHQRDRRERAAPERFLLDRSRERDRELGPGRRTGPAGQRAGPDRRERPGRTGRRGRRERHVGRRRHAGGRAGCPVSALSHCAPGSRGGEWSVPRGGLAGGRLPVRRLVGSREGDGRPEGQEQEEERPGHLRHRRPGDQPGRGDGHEQEHEAQAHGESLGNDRPVCRDGRGPFVV